MNPPVPNCYDPRNAAALCQFAADAYLGGEGSPSRPRKPGPGVPAQIDCAATGTRAVIHLSDDDVVVSFRGTAGLRNWITDIDARLIQDGTSRIHAGFFIALQSVFNPIAQALSGRKQRLWLTGHSLGGALAMLFARRWSQGPIAGVYTFGQPRVGNAAFRDSYDLWLKTKTFRVVDALDLVPHIPWLCGCYRHCGREIFYGDAPASPQIDRPLCLYAADDILSLISEIIRPTSAEQWLSDHHINRYLALYSKDEPGLARSRGGSGEILNPALTSANSAALRVATIP